jgi:hypothetical protein
MSFSKIEKERLLLRRCNDNEREAQKRFANISYSNTAYNAISTVLEDYNINRREIDAVFNLCVGEIYKRWETLPHLWWSLRKRIHNFAQKFAREYIKEKLKSQKN